MKYSHGKIWLEDRIVDLANFEVRPRVKERDLENNYDSFLEHVPEIRDYFEEKSAFDNSVKEIGDKRPKLIAKELTNLLMMTIKTYNVPVGSLLKDPNFHDKYFIGARCLCKIQKKHLVIRGDLEAKIEEKSNDYINGKFEKYPGYECLIEIPDDGSKEETKVSTFHESLHYLIAKYQAETGRRFIDNFVKEDIPENKKWQVERNLNEEVVENLTDKLLIHDPNSQFENRYGHYSIYGEGFKSKYISMNISALVTGVAVFYGIKEPYLLPLVLVPGRIRDYINLKYKESKREELLGRKTIEPIDFKVKI